jgi:hypothetical protein
VSEALVDCIESILPSIIARMRTPVTPSPVEVKRRQLRTKRMRKRFETAFQESITRREQFAREIARLKTQLLDGGVSTSLIKLVQEGGGTSVPIAAEPSYNSWFPSLPRIDGIPSKELFPEKPSRLLGEVTESPYVVAIVERKDRALLKFKLDYDIENRVSSDSMFSEFLRVVESTVRRFASFSGLSWEFEVTTPTDVEIPGWKRTVLRIKPYNTVFERSIELWDQLDAEVGRAIESAIQTMRTSKPEKMRELSKNLFIEMDIS